MKRADNRLYIYTAILGIAVLFSAAAVFAFLPGLTAKLIADLYPPVLGALGTWFAYRIYRSIRRGRQARRLWALLTTGLGFWALGEITRAVYDFALLDVPYPSLADLFYMISCFLITAFFALQVRFLHFLYLALRLSVRPLAFALIFLFVSLAGVFIYTPMFAEPSGNWLEFGVNLLFGTQYLALLIGATVLTLALYEGILGRQWVILAIGVWLFALAGLIYIYADWHGLYYPNGQVTPFSMGFDLLYIVSCLVMVTGIICGGRRLSRLFT